MRKGMRYAEKWLRQMDMSKSFKNPSKTRCTDLRLAMLSFPAEPRDDVQSAWARPLSRFYRESCPAKIIVTSINYTECQNLQCCQKNQEAQITSRNMCTKCMSRLHHTFPRHDTRCACHPSPLSSPSITPPLIVTPCLLSMRWPCHLTASYRSYITLRTPLIYISHLCRLPTSHSSRFRPNYIN